MYAKVYRPLIQPKQLLRADLVQVLGSVLGVHGGRDGLQHLVPLVCGAEFGRSGLGRGGVQQEPESVSGGRGRQGISGTGGGAGVGKGRALDEDFTVDGRLLEAWPSVKSFQPNDREDSPLRLFRAKVRASTRLGPGISPILLRIWVAVRWTYSRLSDNSLASPP